MITPNVQLNGFCVTTTGHSNSIAIGWYKNDMIHGNWMLISGECDRIVSSGWYYNNVRIGDMKDHELFKKFTIFDIFC